MICDYRFAADEYADDRDAADLCQKLVRSELSGALVVNGSTTQRAQAVPREESLSGA